MYPVMLNVRGKSCLVVGGGGVALRKVHGLLNQGARVTLVAPQANDALMVLSMERKLTYRQRDYRPGEAKSYTLVFAATDDRAINRRVFEDAEQHGVWANVADDPELCSFHLPARIQRGPLQLAIASGGEAPFAVRRLRQLLEKRFGEEWAEWVEAAARFRDQVRDLGLSASELEAKFDDFFESTVDTDDLTARVPVQNEQDQWLAAATSETIEPEEPRRPTGVPTQTATPLKGFVSLVGSGPGDPGLLTVRGRQCLMEADAVVYDNLAATALPCDLPPQVELHCVGKRAGHHPVPQQEIQALLVRLAGRGKRVVRLKGGDPYVFGRGGEEAEELVEHGIPFEVVPCVTAGVAVSAYAGIPVTHRGEVVRVTLVTAHESKKTDGPQVRWDLLAQDPHATILGYMGVTSLPQVAKKLIDAGMDPNTPAAMIQRGTTSAQRTVKSTIVDLHAAVEEAGIKPPALFAIGPPVAKAKNLDWFETQPLFGERLVIPASAQDVARLLSRQGAQLVEVPLPTSPAAKVVMNALPLTGCVVETPEQVDALEEDRHGPSWGSQVIAWCTSAKAAQRARDLGWPAVEQIDGDQQLVQQIAQKGAGATRTQRPS